MNYGLTNCIIVSEYPDDLKILFQERYDFEEINSIINNEMIFTNISTLSKINKDFQKVGLLIEDELGNIIDFIRGVTEVGDIQDLFVCKNLPTANKFIEVFQQIPILVGLDFRLESLPISETQNLYDALKLKWPEVPVIGITQFEKSTDKANISLKNKMRSNGDSVYLKHEISPALPNIIRDKIAIFELRNELKEVRAENQKLSKALPDNSGKPYLVGSSLAMRLVYNDLLKLQNIDNIRILILGEPGTGKELVARAIHEDSPRGRNSNFPFIEIDCPHVSGDTNSAISKLFGHKKGSYTDAISDKQGVFELGNNGTIFLDEVGDLPLEAQTKLLRFLETGRYTRLGEDEKSRTANVRIICATNADLPKLIQEGKFREDFYSRIAERIINLPRLCERNGDLFVLANYFIQHEEIIKNTFGNKNIRFKFDNDAQEILKDFDYPANIRDLKALVKNAMIEAKFDNIFRDGSLIISASHILEGAIKKGLKNCKTEMNISYLEDDCMEVEDFLDKVEAIIEQEFKNYQSVSQQDFLKKFPSSKTGIFGMKRQSFTNDELNPRKDCIVKLLNKFPARWKQTRQKCQFIRTAKPLKSTNK